MAELLPQNTDEEMIRYAEAETVKRYSGLDAKSIKGGIVKHDPIRGVEGVYVNLQSGGQVHIGDRPVTPAQSAQTDIIVQQQDQMIAPEPGAMSASPVAPNGRAPIEEIIGGQFGPQLEDYLAAGYTEKEVQDFQQWDAQRREAEAIQRGDLFPVTLEPDQIEQLSTIPGSEMVQPSALSLRDRVQNSLFNAMDPTQEKSGPVADAIGSALRAVTGGQDMDPGDLRFWSNFLTDFVDISVPGVGGALTVDEGARMFNSGWQSVQQGEPRGAVDMTIGALFTLLGAAEFVPYVNSLGEPAKNMLRQASPSVKNMIADAVGASTAIRQGDKDMLLEVFQPAGTPRSLSAAGADTSYRMQHQPRGPQDENPVRLDDLTKSTTGETAGYPEDFYSASGPRFYAPGPQFAGDEYGQANRESYNAIKAVRGKPDAEVTIYRAVPNDPDITTINEGDFVTLSKTYAEIHGASGYGRSGDEPGKVISQRVRVSEIYWDGNDVNEFGYFPSSATAQSTGKTILEMNIKADKRLSDLFDAAGVSADSPLEEIDAVLRRAVRSDIMDERDANKIIVGLRD